MDKFVSRIFDNEVVVGRQQLKTFNQLINKLLVWAQQDGDCPPELRDNLLSIETQIEAIREEMIDVWKLKD